MAIQPNTNVRLLKLPLYLDNKNQITFQNKNKQFEYFDSLDYLEIDHCSYQRKDGIIRYPAHIDSIIQYNYVMYQNENYGNKWFYAYITKMEYDNNNMTKIYIITDVFQTWQFDLTFLESFVEREMINVAEDTPGANLIPEGLETGEFKVGGTAEFDDLEPVNIVAYSGDNVPSIPWGATFFPITQGGFTVNGIVSTICFIIASTNSAFIQLMNALQSSNYSDFIVACFTVPKLAVSSFMNSSNAYPSGTDELYILQNGNSYNQSPTLKNLVSTPSQIDGYTPRNQKLRTYPFMYIGFSPKGGSQKIYRYEDFTNGTPSFKIISEVNPNPSIYLIPQNYRGDNGDSLSDCVSFNGYPNLASKSDVYNIWLAQNSQIISLQMEQENFNYQVSQMKNAMGLASNLLSTGMGNVSGLTGVGNSALDMVSTQVNHEYYIKQTMAQMEKQSMLPDNASLSGSNATLLGYNMFDKNIFTRYTIKRQFAERIDKYFDMYGYTTNTRKVPNIKNRPKWNYIKTQGVNIRAFIPQEDLQIIKNMFDTGVTLWHDTSTFLDYSQNNRA